MKMFKFLHTNGISAHVDGIIPSTWAEIFFINSGFFVPFVAKLRNKMAALSRLIMCGVKLILIV